MADLGKFGRQPGRASDRLEKITDSRAYMKVACLSCLFEDMRRSRGLNWLF